MTMQVGVVGLGQMGILHAAIANSVPMTKTVAICDSDSRLTKIAAKVAPSIVFYDNLTKFLESEHLDAVFVCTPAQTHLEVLSKISKSTETKAVFVEKPIASNYSDALRIVGGFPPREYLTMVGFQKRYCGTFSKAKELLTRGALGDLLVFSGHHYVSENYGEGTNWKFKPDTGGVALEFAPHLIDMILWFFGTPKTVASVRKRMFSSQVEDYLHVQLEYRSGVIGQIDASWSMRNFRPGEFMLEIHGTNGTINVSDDRLIVHVDRDVPGVLEAGRLFIPRSKLDPTVPFLLANPENVYQDVHFLNCVRSSQRPEPSFESAAEVNWMLERILEGQSI